MQVNRNSVFHRFGLRCFNLFERLCRIRCVAIDQKFQKGDTRLEGVEQRGWGWHPALLIYLKQFIKSQQAGGWHSFCKSRRHFKATSDPLLCQAVLAVPVECWRAACRLQACSRIRSEARHNAASSTRRFNVQESFIIFWSWLMGDWKSCLRQTFAWKACRRWSGERG